MRLSYGYGPATEKKEAITLTQAAFGPGASFFDTAEIYGPFTKEELVGEALVPYKGQAVIATELSIQYVDGKQMVCSNPNLIKSWVEGSLNRLGLETIDLYY